MQAVRFYVAVFLGAFLLFLVQPLMAKQILPWFGGGSVVWASCLLFFQVALVAGYAYAHVSRRLGVRRQVWLHLILLAVALVTLPITPAAAWKPIDGAAPVSRVLGVLTLTVGVPYVLLAATAPMLQDWFARRFPERSPYRLYVLSNIGSLLALGVYPLYLERYLDLRPQAVLWSAGFAAFLIVCAWCARSMREASAEPVVQPSVAEAAPIGAIDRLLWVVLPAIGSGLLVATTSSLTQDVAAVPLIWIVPLALYLVTFILAFAGWYWRWAWGSALVLLLAAAVIYANADSETPILIQGIALVAAFTAAAMVCHGELAELRPAPAHLTGFYLALSIGGSLGAAFVTLLAPLLFTWYFELPLLFMLAVAALLGLGCRELAREYSRVLAGSRPSLARERCAMSARSCFARCSAKASSPRAAGIYGMLRVFDEGTPRRSACASCGMGASCMASRCSFPPSSGARRARTMRLAAELPRRSASIPAAIRIQSLKIGVVGLGSGTVAALGQPFDRIRFFEIDPLVVRFSNQVLHLPQGLAGTNGHLARRRPPLPRARDGLRAEPAHLRRPRDRRLLRRRDSGPPAHEGSVRDLRAGAPARWGARRPHFEPVHRFAAGREGRRRPDRTADPRDRPGLWRTRRRDWQHVAARHAQ